MYYISHKRQAKIISPNSSPSSTDLTNNKKKLVSNRSWLPSTYFKSLKKLVSKLAWIPSNYFFYYKKQQATSKQRSPERSYFFKSLKKLVSNRPGFPSNYFWPLKKLVSRAPEGPLNLYFFIIKSNKQQASSRQLAVPLFFFI